MNLSSPFLALLGFITTTLWLTACIETTSSPTSSTFSDSSFTKAPPTSTEVPPLPAKHTLPMSSSDFEKLVKVDPFLQQLDTSVTIRTKVYDLKNDSLWVVILQQQSPPIGLEIFIRGYQKTLGFFLALEASSTSPGFTGDTLIDVDFDGDYDYVYGYYSPVGCCYRDQAHIYFNQNGKILPTPYSILNPYFDAEHQTVQTMGYGFPPDVGLSKHIWQADTLFLIESVFINRTYIEADTAFHYDGNFLVVDERTGEERLVDSIPQEYTYLSDHYFLDEWVPDEE